MPIRLSAKEMQFNCIMFNSSQITKCSRPVVNIKYHSVKQHFFKSDYSNSDYYSFYLKDKFNSEMAGNSIVSCENILPICSKLLNHTPHTPKRMPVAHTMHTFTFNDTCSD
jgi:hypothetical protein